MKHQLIEGSSLIGTKDWAIPVNFMLKTKMTSTMKYMAKLKRPRKMAQSKSLISIIRCLEESLILRLF